MRLHLANVTFPNSHPLAGQTGVVNGFAVRHPDGILLVDTGIGLSHPFIDSSYTPARRHLGDALTEAGISLDSISCVVNTHLHWDHCGGNSLFPDVPIFVQATEYHSSEAAGYTISTFRDFPGARYELRDGEAELMSGVLILPTPGHTAGHQSVIIETLAGPIVIAGQAIYSRSELEQVRRDGALRSIDPPPDPRSYLKSVKRLVRLEPRRVFFSHDAEVWEPPTRPEYQPARQ